MMRSSKQFGLKDIIDSPPQLPLGFSYSTAGGATATTNTTTTSTSNNNDLSSKSAAERSDRQPGHRPGTSPVHASHPFEKDLAATNNSSLLISPSTATDTSERQHQQHQRVMAATSPPKIPVYQQQQNIHPNLDSSSFLEQYQNRRKTGSTSKLQTGAAATTSTKRADQIQAATTNLSAALDSDLVSSINTSQGGDLHFAQEFRQALSKAYFKIEAQDKIITELRLTLDRERKLFSERLDTMKRDHVKQVDAMESEHKADRTFLVQAKHDRDRFDRQYHDLLELAERREQEQQLEMNRWENERQTLSKRVNETASSAKNMSQLLEAAQSRVRALEEQLADRDQRLTQLQNECAATRNEVVGYEKKVREGLLVDARISQKWLSEADSAKRDNQALCASLLRSMNLLSRTVEYGPLLTKGALGEGFVYCGADPNVNFGSTSIADATSNAAVLNSLVHDANTLLRNSSVPPIQTTASPNSFPSIFENHGSSSSAQQQQAFTQQFKSDLLKCESDFWIPKPAHDLLGRLLGWMEHACALKITPQVEQNLLPALHEWFVVLNAVWRERADQKVRAAIQQHNQKLERDAEKRRIQQQAQPSRFGSTNSVGSSSLIDGGLDDENGKNNNNKRAASCGSLVAAGSQQLQNNNTNNNGNTTLHCWEVSIPCRRTSDRLKSRIEEAKRLSWNKHSQNNNHPAKSSGISHNNAEANSQLSRWSSIAIDAVQSVLDLEKSLTAQQKENEKQRQNVVAANNAASNAVRLAAQTASSLVEARDVEEGLKQAAQPVSYLQELTEQLREHVEDFRDALAAANPDTVTISSTSNTEDENNTNSRKQQRKNNACDKVPLQLLSAVFNVAAEFCDEVDRSAIHLQKVQFDIDKAMTMIASQVVPSSIASAATNDYDDEEL